MWDSLHNTTVKNGVLQWKLPAMYNQDLCSHFVSSQTNSEFGRGGALPDSVANTASYFACKVSVLNIYVKVLAVFRNFSIGI